MKKILTILIAVLVVSAFACNENNIEEGSPSDVLKTFIEAKKRRDVEAVKKTISADSIKLYEDLAKQQNTSVEALLTDNTGGVLQDVPPMRNEKIKGNQATVEAQVPQTGVWQKIPFVKEEDGWKIAMDQVIMEALKKVQETLQETLDKPNEPLPRENTNVESENSTNKSNTNN